MGEIRMERNVRAAIVGSTGYGGVELIRLLAAHPKVEITAVLSSSSAGEPIAAGYPHLTEIRRDLLEEIDPAAVKRKADVVFFATPPGITAKLAPAFLAVGLDVIDISGDLRLKSPALYEQWYKKTPVDQQYLDEAVYGLAEVWGDEVRGARLISNPGCYPTATLLGLIPAVKAGWIDPATIIVDAKSGVSGAGRGVSLANHYSEINENFKAYKIGRASCRERV